MFKSQPAKAGADQRRQDGHDLSTVLSSTQRADLTLLIAGITASMRQVLEHNFDADAGLDKSLIDRRGMTEEEKLMATEMSEVDVAEHEKQKKLRDEYERDINSQATKTLEKDSLQAFDDWRDGVVMRVGEVVNSRETAKQHVEEVACVNADVNTGADEQARLETSAVVKIGRIVEAPESGSIVKFKDIYPPIKNPLTKLPMEQRTLVLHSVLLLLLSLESYSAPSRVLLLLLCSSLKLPLRTFEQDEYATAKGLLEGAKELSAAEETKKKAEENKDSRKWKVGLATAAGAAIIGVTGGLAAPLVAAGVGSVMGGLGLGATSAATYLGSVAGSTYLIGGLFGAYGGRMTGSMMDNYARQIEDFEFLPVHSGAKTAEDSKQGAKEASSHDHKLRVTICVSGWLTEKEEVVKPWRVLGTAAEVFALKYELEAMLNLGNAIKGFVQSAAWGYAKKQIIAQTILADLAAAMWPLGLMKAARVVDNPFNLAKSKSEKAGELLADALINRAQGERPVTLIGYSLGARLIYSCLMSLAKRKAFGVVENAILIGAPIPSDTRHWRVLRTAVSGRLVNIYSQDDYVLGFMYRTSSLQYGVAGLQAVQGISSVENIDVSDEVTGHLRYRFLIGSILKKIGFEDIDINAVEEEKEALRQMEEEEKQKSLEAQRKRLVRQKSDGGKGDEAADADEEASEIEKDVQAQTQKSLVTRAVEYFYTPSVPNARQSQESTVSKATTDRSAESNTAEKGSSPTQSLGQRVYGGLPTMPYLNRPDQQKSSATTRSVQDGGANRESLTSTAAGYLPSMPKSLPSMPFNLGKSSKDQPK